MYRKFLWLLIKHKWYVLVPSTLYTRALSGLYLHVIDTARKGVLYGQCRS